MRPGESITRRNLPHWYVPGMAHFVTYRLADTIPSACLKEWRDRRERLKQRGPQSGPAAQSYRQKLHKQFFAAYDEYLDANRTRRWLAEPRIATVVRNNLYHHNGVKYELLAWCVMPNHAHVLLQPFEPPPDGADASNDVLLDLPSDEIADTRCPLSGIMHSLKSYTANEANRILNRSGRFWQHESYDHWVRDLDELERIAEYIRLNPIRAPWPRIGNSRPRTIAINATVSSPH